METTEKKALTDINKIPLFQEVMKLLTIDQELDHDQKVYVLSCAIIFLKHYEQDKRLTSYAEFAYYIILKYSLRYKDFTPLYDFTCDFGYYPISKAILKDGLLPEAGIERICNELEFERYRSENYIETVHQFSRKRELVADNTDEISYIAPTSFGKSAVMIDCIGKFDQENTKIGIIVPTKSLLMQTYRMIRAANLGYKILIHDEMYLEHKSFIAVFTQERALRLLSKHPVAFNVLFVDEAHNLLKDDQRSILLTRLIAKNRLLNPEQKVIYLSPLVEDTNNLKVVQDQNISQHKIPFNIKEPEIFEYNHNGDVTQYNRFVNSHYLIGNEKNIFDYINKSAHSKNFLYLYSPISIEKAAKELSDNVSTINSDAVKNLISILKKEVHDKFYAVKYLEKGVIYLHGKLPDLIKEYLESKFKDVPEIRYIIANSVILEGMNLPIDNLYILNTHSLYGKEMTNLIGRVNRLNTIFSDGGSNLYKLLPKVHFLNNNIYGRKDGKMGNKINLLRSRTFKDKVQNPTLNMFDVDKLEKSVRDRKKSHYEKIQEEEFFLTQLPANSTERLKQYLIETGISNLYDDLDKTVSILEKRIEATKSRKDWSALKMMDKINDLFIAGAIVVKDNEFKRINYPEARSYYDHHITISQKKSLKENVNHMFAHFKKRIADNNSKVFFGSTYGDVGVTDDVSEARVWVDLKTKNDDELINLAIVKLKMEDDFISFKLNKFIIMLFDYSLISVDDYNLYIYGTTDQNKIDLSKRGLSVSLISRLEEANQLQYIYYDEYNNLKATPEFDVYKNSIDDFYKFEIERFLN